MTPSYTASADGEKASYQNISSHGLDGSMRTDSHGQLESGSSRHSAIWCHVRKNQDVLTWRSIRKLLRPCRYDYAMTLEQHWQRLSGIHESFETPMATNSELRTMPSSIQESANFAPRKESDVELLNQTHLGVEINEWGQMNLDQKIARVYYRNYLLSIQMMHPFLDQRTLDVDIEEFIKLHCLQEFEAANLTTALTRVPVTQHTRSALFLLIMAIGAICGSRSLLSGPLMGEISHCSQQHIPSRRESSPVPSMARSGGYSSSSIISFLPTGHPRYLTPSHAIQPQYPNRHNTSQSFHSLDTDSIRSQTTLRQSDAAAGDDGWHSRGKRVIPGLSLYKFATAIMDPTRCTPELSNIQAGLLAGLYAGQLADPLLGHSWIYQASRACRRLTRQSRYEALEEGSDKDLCNFAFWCCLKLEGDFAAGLQMPKSHMFVHEDRIRYPRGEFTLVLPYDPIASITRTMLFYKAHLQLSSIFNRVRTNLPNIEALLGTHDSCELERELCTILKNWKENLPAMLKWQHDEAASADLLVARLRAKYYEASHLIHRPKLHHLLQRERRNTKAGLASQTSPNLATKEPLFSWSCHTSNLFYPSSPPRPSSIRRDSDICVESAIKSIEAFDKVDQRQLVVPNIFGIAHGHFETMLFIIAAYNSGHDALGIDAFTLKRLMLRTLKFNLHNGSGMSPTLRADFRILTEVYEKIFGENPASLL